MSDNNYAVNHPFGLQQTLNERLRNAARCLVARLRLSVFNQTAKTESIAKFILYEFKI
jgi:hypothetical protein